MNRRFQPYEIDFLKENYPKYGAFYCSDILKRTNNSIKTFCRKHNIKLLYITRCKLAEKSKQKNMSDFKVNVEIFNNIDTPETAYVLGVLWGDGFIYKKYRIILDCVIDDANEFYKIFKKTGDWNWYFKKSKKINEKDKGVIQTSNKFLVSFLDENDYRIKSKESACKILQKIPKNLQKYFFIGLTDADGSFYYNRKTGQCRQFSIYSTYEQNWTYVENLFKNLNINYTIHRIKTKKSKSSMIRITGQNNIKKYGEFIYDTYTEDNIGLFRKYQIYSEIINQNKHE